MRFAERYVNIDQRNKSVCKDYERVVSMLRYKLDEYNDTERTAIKILAAVYGYHPQTIKKIVKDMP